MKWFVLYWVVGCLLMGSTFALNVVQNPDMQMPSGVETFAGVATWPVAIPLTVATIINAQKSKMAGNQ